MDAGRPTLRQRPELDEVSRLAIEEKHATATTRPASVDGSPDAPEQPPDRPDGAQRADGDGGDGTDNAPEVILWAALSLAPEEGVTVPNLMTATGMSRPWDINGPPTATARRHGPSRLSRVG